MKKKARLMKKRKKRGVFGKMMRGGRHFTNPKVSTGAVLVGDFFHVLCLVRFERRLR